MKIEKNGQTHSSSNDEPAHQAFDATNAIERGTGIAIACNVLVAMPTHAIAHDMDVLGFVLRMLLIADMAATSLAQVIVDIVRSTRQRPLVRVDLSATDITDLRLSQVHLLFRAG